MGNNYPYRHRPTHRPPVHKNNRPTLLFVTVNILNREPILNNQRLHETIKDIWLGRNTWQVGYYLIMPDHIHLFCAPGQEACSVNHWVKFWKERLSKAVPEIKGKWQRDCWDTQMRNGDHYQRKLEYVANNPVRKGFTTESEEWPYQGNIGELPWYAD